MKYDDWEEATEHGKLAVAPFGLIQTPKGNLIKTDIIKRKGEDGYIVFAKSMRKIRKATPKEVDATKGWKAL